MTHPISIWFETIRPKTVLISMSAILVGNALASLTQEISLPILFLSLITAALLQIISNIANDLGDWHHGTDCNDRVGPQRGIHKGLITIDELKVAVGITIALASITGVALLYLSCHSLTEFFAFITLGIISIIAAITYTMGEKPYGYRGFGDISVLVFFGWLSVSGAFYLQTHNFNTLIFLPATATGLLAVGILNLNNLRDCANDLNSGKNTLIVKIGPKWGRIYHAAIFIIAFLCLAIFIYLQKLPLICWSFLVILPICLKHIKQVFQSADRHALAPLFEDAVKCALLTNIIFSTTLLSI